MADALQNSPASVLSGISQEAESLNVIAAYDAFAPYYKAYAQNRSRYLEEIEKIVIEQTRNAASLLDVGAGDGARGLRIAGAVGATRVVLAEPSTGMRAQCPQDAEVWPCSASELPQASLLFELIICLWNVLGHIDGAQQRITALSRLKNLLSPGGRIFLDVSHRYNMASYGVGKTLLRMTHDFLSPSEEHGDVTVAWRAGTHLIHMRGHVFTSPEMKRLFNSVGLRIVRRWVINYKNGQQRRLPIFGHLLYQLTAG